ncbi:MAG: hypothetical protein J6P57_05840 [Lachnospiraceae bacterium]|nr:hypothetical protein [Lachnospiraceae bacterium]
MRLKKGIILVTTAMMLTAGLAGCKEKKDDKVKENGNKVEDTANSTETLAADSLEAKSRFIYNGTEFGVGNKGSDIVSMLGEQAQIKPSEKSQPCIPGAGEIETFYYPGFIIQVTQYDVIATVCLTNDYDESKDCSTIGGLKLGQTIEDAKNIIGTDNMTEDEFGLNYQDGDKYLSISVRDDGSIFSIKAEDMSIEY